MKKKTILEICLSNGNGGLELYFHRCGTQLRSRGYNVITVRSEGTFLSNLIENKQVNDLFLAPTAPWKRWLYFRAVCKIIKTYKIDIVHAHHKDDLPLVALVKTFSRKKVKVYFTRQMPLPHRKFDWYHRWLYGKLDGMIAITEKLKQDILEKIPISPGRVHRLYYGVAAPPILDEQWTKDFLSISQPGDFNLGVFSRFEFQKGQHTVIESLKMLRDRGIPAKLYLAGNVAEKEYVEFIKKKITEYALDEVVSFKGFMKEPMRAMQAVDVYILPSRAEAFGLVLAEAMRCGTLVIGTRAGGVPEIIDHENTGLLYDWDNADQLRELLTKAYSNISWCTTLAQNGKSKADTQFNEVTHFDSLSDLLTRD